jgi:radical SAM superfamily enzyme
VLIAPTWPETKTEIFRLITQEFQRRGTRQGALMHGLISSSAV